MKILGTLGTLSLSFGILAVGLSMYLASRQVDADEPAAGTSANATFPKIQGYGSVVRLATAAHQPRPGTRLVVDVTRGDAPAQVNDGLAKVAKYLNLYAGGGAETAEAEIAVVIHGDTTLAVLSDDHYRRQFDVQANPHLPLLRKLRDADVQIFVCGQSLLSKGSLPEHVDGSVQVAVSAMTALVNLQTDGYAYLPMLK